MPVDTIFSVLSLIFAAVVWRGVQAVSLVPSVPDRVQALAGSCVVIPCSFTPQALQSPRGRKKRVDVRLRFRGGGLMFPLASTAFNSEDRDQVSRDFLGRTTLFGQIADGDCSLKIDRVTHDDPKVFEVTLKKGDEFLWGKPRKVNLDVIDTPEPPTISGRLSAAEGQLVTLNCSASFHCPSSPPALHWRWEQGAQLNITEPGEVQTLSPDSNRQTLLASVSFTVSHKVKPRLRCDVSYPGAKTLTAAKDLHVMFPPKDVKIQVQTLTVQEGGSALLVCSCKADPPASEYRWSYVQHGRTVHLHQRLQTVRVYNVTRDMRLRCSAKNLIGRGESPPTPLNIQYKPTILQLSSSCVVEDSEVLCRCSVDSNPKPAVTWSVNGTFPPDDYNVSVTSETSLLTASLRGFMNKPVTVICFAVNALGNDSLVLLQEEEEAAPLLLLVLPAAAGFVCLLASLLLLLVICHRKRTERHIMNRRPAMYPEGLGIYQERMPLYINCTEVTHVYTNGSYQLIYQNSTPLFVHNKQICPMARRGGERRRGGKAGGMNRGPGVGVRGTREVQGSDPADPETAIYLEIL